MASHPVFPSTGGVEPTLEEVLAEPIVQLIMQRDGVPAQEMRSTLQRLWQAYDRLHPQMQ